MRCGIVLDHQQQQPQPQPQTMTMEWSEWDPLVSDGNNNNSTTTCTVDARERHKLAERERRKSMRDLFLSLHQLLPNPTTVRTEQSAILEETIKYIPVAAARLRALRHSKTNAPAPPTTTPTPARAVVHGCPDCDIRVEHDPSSTVSIRVRGDRVNVSVTDNKAPSKALPLSAVLDLLESHQLEIVRSTHCRDGIKLVHHSETNICDGLDRSPAAVKGRLQELASKLDKLRKPSSTKRSFDQIEN